MFVTSTGEAPGTNRLELSGDRGKIVVEDDRLVFWRLRVSEREFNATYKGGFGSPEAWKCEIPVTGENSGHLGILRNWIDAILKGTPLLAPGCEGIYGLEISNAMHLSSWTDAWVELPIDEDLFYEMLQDRSDFHIQEKADGRTLDVRNVWTIQDRGIKWYGLPSLCQKLCAFSLPQG